LPVYKQEQQKSVFNCPTSDILHNYVMVMKVIRRFFRYAFFGANWL